MAPTSEQIRAFLARLHRAIAENRLHVRAYALDGLRDLEWTAEDLRLQLSDLTVDDLLRTETSTAPRGGLVWVFTPEFWDGGFSGFGWSNGPVSSSSASTRGEP